MYERVGEVDDAVLSFLKGRAMRADWKVVKGSGRDYLTSFCGDDVKGVFSWQHWQSAFFLKLPPGGKVHRHVDVLHPWKTYHVVVETNEGCVSYTDVPQHLEAGGIYSIDRTVEHWSENNGQSDRIHLLAEVYD